MNGISSLVGRLALTIFQIALASFFTADEAEVAAQSQANNLKQPAGLAVHPSSGHAFFVEQETHQLLRWDGKDKEVIVEDLASDPILLEQVRALEFRDSQLLSVVGTSTNGVRLVSFNIIEGKPILNAKLSGDLDLDEAEQVTSMTSTHFALYLATSAAGESGDEKSSLWKVNHAVNKPKRLTAINALMSGLAMSPQGHLVVAVKEQDGSNSLHFHHAETGQRLLVIPTDVKDVTSLSYGKSGLLYATATKNDRRGIYRFDVFFDGRRQSARAIEIVQLDNAIVVACSDDHESAVLVGGENDGRALRLKLK